MSQSLYRLIKEQISADKIPEEKPRVQAAQHWSPIKMLGPLVIMLFSSSECSIWSRLEPLLCIMLALQTDM